MDNVMCQKNIQTRQNRFSPYTPKKTLKNIPKVVNENLYSQPHVNVNEKWISLSKKTLFVCCLDMITPLLSLPCALMEKKGKYILH